MKWRDIARVGRVCWGESEGEEKLALGKFDIMLFICYLSEKDVNMKRQAYRSELLAKDLQPYVELMKKYFGVCHPDIEHEVSLSKWYPDHEYSFVFFVTAGEIQNVVEHYFPDLGDKSEEVVGLLWLVCNLYYGDSIEKYERFFDFDADTNRLSLEVIQKEIANLFLFLHSHVHGKPITIKIGKDKCVLNDSDEWFQSVMDNQVFPHVIPLIQSTEDAKDLIEGKRGRPETRRYVNAILNGVAQFFFDSGFVDDIAPLNLCQFLKHFLVLMDLIDEKETETVDEAWIKTQIHIQRKSKKNPRLGRTGDCSIAKESLAKPDPWDWIFPRKK